MKRAGLFLAALSRARAVEHTGTTDSSAPKRSHIFTVSMAVFALMLFVVPDAIHAANISSTAAGGNWSATTTWVGGVVPVAADNVTIATTSGNKVSMNTSATVASLTVNANGILSFNDNANRSLTVSGTVTNNGTIQAESASGTRTYTLNVGGDFTNNDTFTPTGGDEILNVVLNGSAGTQTVSGTTTFFNLTLNNSGAIGSFGTSSTTIANTLTTSAGTMDGGSSTITFTGASGTMTGVNNKNFFHLVISSGASITNSGSNITIKGNFTNNGSFTTGAFNTTFNGSAAQTIGGSSATVFNTLTVNNSAGVTLNINATASSALALTNGDITTGTNTLFQGSGSTSSGSGDVVGNVNRTDVTAGTTRSFGNVNVQITQGTGTTGADITVKLAKSAPIDFTNAVNRTYDITKNGGTLVALGTTVRLRYIDTELNGNSETTLQLWRKDGSTYTALSSTRDSTANWVESTNVTTFSQWVISGPNAPTECKLESFTASRSADGVVLEWQTGYEVDNIGFNVYREDQSGKLTRLTPHLVAGSALMVRRGTRLTSGLSYSWSDTETKRGDQVRYWLEDLDTSGLSTWNGPYLIDETSKPSPRLPSPGKGRSPMINAVNAQQIEALQALREHQDAAYEPTGQLERKAKMGKLTVAGLTQQTDLAGKPAVKISVRQEGWYRVSQPELLAAGLSASIDPKKLQLFVDGQQIPIIVQGENDGKFDASDSIEFYGLGLDTASTDTHVYWLIAGSQPGDRIKQAKGSGGTSAGASFPYTVQRKDRLYYFSNIRNGETENFFGAFIYYQSTDQTLNVAHISPAADAKLELAMQGFNAVPHQIDVSVNGALVGTLNFNGQVYSTSTLTFAQSLLHEGTNTVSMVAQGGNNDFSFVDYLRLTYAHSYSADNNSLKFTASSGRSVTVSGFGNSSLRVVDVTNSKSPQEVTGKVNQDPQGYSITLTTPGTGTRTLLAFADSQAKAAAKVAANKPSAWKSSSNSADLVIIGYGEFSSSLQSLKSLRDSQGLQTQLVDVEDVYDEFSYGNKSPQSLKDFLSYARTNWAKAPRYVLLGGTASFDPRNYLGLGETDLVPTKFVETQRIETASDDALADFNGDGIPEMAVGRLPARTADEAARMVQKVISYDQAPASGVGALLVADANSGYDFEAVNDQLSALVPASTTVQDIRRGGDPQAKQHLLDALNQGQKVVNYTGHGSVGIWEASLLTTTDAAALTNSQKLSVVVAMTCLNAYYFDERFESLAHALINAQTGGAVAMWSSSGLTDPASQAVADQELFRQLFAGASIRLGDATIKAKMAVGDVDVRRTWILIGDPTTTFKQ